MQTIQDGVLSFVWRKVPPKSTDSVFALLDFGKFSSADELHMGSCPLYGGSLGISRKLECVSTFVICVLYFKSQRMQMAN